MHNPNAHPDFFQNTHPDFHLVFKSIFYFHIKIGKRIGQMSNNIKFSPLLRFFFIFYCRIRYLRYPTQSQILALQILNTTQTTYPFPCILRINKFLEISPSTEFQARAVTDRLLCLQRCYIFRWTRYCFSACTVTLQSQISNFVVRNYCLNRYTMYLSLACMFHLHVPIHTSLTCHEHLYDFARQK